MKWLLEYSKDQDKFHIQSEQERLKNPHNKYNPICTNGYTVIAVCDSEKEADEKHLFYINVKDNKPIAFNALLQCLNDLDTDLLAMIIAAKIEMEK